MKIGLVRRGFSRTGGAEVYLKRLGRALVDGGHAVTLYATPDWPQAEWPYGPMVPVLGKAPVTFANAVKHLLPSDGVSLSLERLWTCDVYRAGDGVHARWLELRKAHEPGWRSSWRRWHGKHREILRLERSLFSPGGSRAAIVNSEMVKREIVETFGYPADRITVIRNGLPDRHFRKTPGTRAERRHRWDILDNRIAVVFAGSGAFRKGLKYALAAFREISDPRLLLLVAGDVRRRLAPGNVRFLGPVADMASLYGAADLFLLPTLYDPFSNACLEAASFGLPIITTAANGFAELMRPGLHGEVLPRADDVPALRHALLAWADPARREAAKDACADLAQNLSINDNLQRTLAVLRALP